MMRGALGGKRGTGIQRGRGEEWSRARLCAGIECAEGAHRSVKMSVSVSSFGTYATRVQAPKETSVGRQVDYMDDASR